VERRRERGREGEKQEAGGEREKGAKEWGGAGGGGDVD
jgi:hypothetical protein